MDCDRLKNVSNVYVKDGMVIVIMRDDTATVHRPSDTVAFARAIKRRIRECSVLEDGWQRAIE